MTAALEGADDDDPNPSRRDALATADAAADIGDGVPAVTATEGTDSPGGAAVRVEADPDNGDADDDDEDEDDVDGAAPDAADANAGDPARRVGDAGPAPPATGRSASSDSICVAAFNFANFCRLYAADRTSTTAPSVLGVPLPLAPFTDTFGGDAVAIKANTGADGGRFTFFT